MCLSRRVSARSNKLSGEDGRSGRGGAEAAADRDGGGVLVGDGGGDGVGYLSRIGSEVTILSLETIKDFALAGRLAITIFVLVLASKESNVFFVIIVSIII